MPRAQQRALDAFSLRQPVFTVAEYLAAFPELTAQAAREQLRYAVRARRLFRVKHDLFQDADVVDPIGIAARWAPDAVIAYETAFRVHFGTGLPTSGPAYFLSATDARSRRDVDNVREVIPLRPPRPLGPAWNVLGISQVEYGGAPIRMTSDWRTLVDVLDRVELAPPIEDWWPAFFRGPRDLVQMAEYALRLKSVLCGARLGFFFDHLPWAPKEVLAVLPSAKVPTCIDRRRHPGGNRRCPKRNVLVPLPFKLQVERTEFYRGEARIPPPPK